MKTEYRESSLSSVCWNWAIAALMVFFFFAGVFGGLIEKGLLSIGACRVAGFGCVWFSVITLTFLLAYKADAQRGEQEKKFAAALNKLEQRLTEERGVKDSEVRAYKALAIELEIAIVGFREAVINKLSTLADDGSERAFLNLVRSTPEFKTLLGIDEATLDQLVEAIARNMRARSKKPSVIPPVNS